MLCLFIEGAIVGPPDRVWPGVRGGSGLLALRTGAPIVPFALAGTDELYRGKRIAARILPPVSVAELLGADWPGQPPEQDTRAELEMARRDHATASRTASTTSCRRCWRGSRIRLKHLVGGSGLTRLMR